MGALRPAKILLVDDDELGRALLEASLEPLGQTLVQAASGTEALRLLEEDEFAVVLLDVRMAGLDGFETATRIKQREKTRHVPLIFLTGSSSLRDVLHGYSTGAVDFILKPFDPDVLRSKVAVFVDLHNLRREAELMTHRALHDDLTGLPNRTLFVDRLRMALARMERSRMPLAVLFLDLDGFKRVNDSFGHEAGDRVLVEAADRIKRCLRPCDSVARFGGDEFTLLCEGIATGPEAAVVAERIQGELSVPIAVGDREVSLAASIGIALGRDPGASPEGLLREADAAMYRAKEHGSRCMLFGDRMRAGISRRLNGERALRRALDRDELWLLYQPQISLDSADLVGIEALLRWDDPGRGLVSPAEFIPLAEQSGLIAEIGAWTLKEACRVIQSWREVLPNRPPPTVSVNFSPRQLARPDFVGVLTDILDETNTDPSSLCLELTEGVLIEKGEGPAETLAELRRLGLGIAIDDFGTGYASISHLRGFPVDVLKIDQTFVDGLGRDPRDSALTAAMVNLGRALGLTVIAEGVETPDQLAELHALGCDAAQGFYLAAPKSWREILVLARHGSGQPMPFLPEAVLGGETAEAAAPEAAAPEQQRLSREAAVALLLS